jgi:hypothetical protein
LYALERVEAANSEKLEARFDFVRVDLAAVEAMPFWNNI